MPVEPVQRNIGVVANLGEIIPHSVPGQHLYIAALFHRHIHIHALVEHLKPHQVVRHLEGGVEHLAVGEVILRAGGFFNGIGGQRKGLAGGDAAFIRCDGVHHFQLVVVDGELRPVQQGAGLFLGDRVIVRRLLDDLDLPPQRAVFQHQLGGLPSLQLHRVDGGVHHIAIAFDLFDLVFSSGQFSREFDHARLVGHIFADQIVPAVVEVEYRPIDGLLGFSINLGEEEGSQGFVE